MSDLHTFKYFVVRCVPRTDREEFINVGVVLYSPAGEFLGAACLLREDRLRALDPEVDLGVVHAALDGLEALCRGDEGAGPAARLAPRDRFGWLAAPRSTVVQPGPVHGGMAEDPAAELAHLLQALVA